MNISSLKARIMGITRGQWLWTGLVCLALLIRVLVALPLVHDWDGYVFSQTAHNLLEGETPYATAEKNSPQLYPDSDRDMTAQWYAYPPLPMLMFTAPIALFQAMGIHTSPMAENLLLKSTFILGDIVCAYLVYRFLAANRKLAKRAALLILFNPLLIWISAAWGMFDIWILNFLLLFLLAIRANKPVWAGVFFGLSLQIKLFPLFFLPAIFIFAYQRLRTVRDRTRLTAAFVLTSLAISLPFLLLNPRGFLNQNLLMHFKRPPQGIGLSGMIDYVTHIYTINPSIAIGLLSILGLATIAIFNLFSLTYIKGKENRLLVIILLIYSSTLAFNKVVNEQYFVIFVALLIILTHLGPGKLVGFTRKGLVRIETVATVAVLFAAVVLGFHFLTFIPSFMATSTLGSSTQNSVYFLSGLFPWLPLHTYPNSLFTYYNLPVIITYLLLIPLVGVVFWIVARGLREAFAQRRLIARDVIKLLRRYGRQTALAAAASAIIVIPAAYGLYKANAFTPIELEHATSGFPADPKVGTFYNVWWNNASHLPDDADGAWAKTTQKPLAGYYTSKNAYYSQHINQMKSAGIDFAAVSYHLYDRERYLTFSDIAEKSGFYSAPLIETGDALDKPEYHPTQPQGETRYFQFAINDSSRKAYAKTIVSSLIDTKDKKSTMRIDNKPVVYIYDGHWFYPGYDSASKQALAQILVDSYKAQGKGFADISAAWNTPVTSLDDVIANYPADVVNFSDEDAIAKDYKAAFLKQYAQYWKLLRADVEKEVGPVYLISTYASETFPRENFIIEYDDLPSLGIFDSEFFYSISNTWVHWRYVATTDETMKVWERQVTNQAARDRAAGWPFIATVMPGYDDTKVRGNLGFKIPSDLRGNTYSWAWETALAEKPDYVMIATWNEFFEGSAIEPTVEQGSTRLDQTKTWIERLHQQSPIQAALRR